MSKLWTHKGHPIPRPLWGTKGCLLWFLRRHYNDVIMTTMASQITSLTVVYSTVYSNADQRKHQSSASLTFVWGIHRTGEFPAQGASYAGNVSIWWRHHDNWLCYNATGLRLVHVFEQLRTERDTAHVLHQYIDIKIPGNHPLECPVKTKQQQQNKN